MAKRENLFFGKIVFFDGREYDPCTPEPDFDTGSGGTPMNTPESESPTAPPPETVSTPHSTSPATDTHSANGRLGRSQDRHAPDTE